MSVLASQSSRPRRQRTSSKWPIRHGGARSLADTTSVHLILNLLTGGWYLGSIVAAWTTYGTSRNIHSTFAWRIPVAVQAGPSVIVLAVVLFLPETPRWLVSVGRRTEARLVLGKYHANNNLRSPIVRLQMSEIDEYILIDGSDKRWWDYSDLFSSRNARYRSFMVLTMAVFGQWYLQQSV